MIEFEHLVEERSIDHNLMGEDLNLGQDPCVELVDGFTLSLVNDIMFQNKYKTQFIVFVVIPSSIETVLLAQTE